IGLACWNPAVAMPGYGTKTTQFRNIKDRRLKTFAGGIIKGEDKIRLSLFTLPWWTLERSLRSDPQAIL
ncbi:MAG: hypothetical protein MK240_07880, partial [Opitutales bacterium]|nr:hypothetical protein [Opitutales bacterium]